MHFDRATAVEKVHSRIFVFRPRVYGVVRLLNDDRTGNAIRLELVERVSYYSGFAGDRRIVHDLSDVVFSLERRRIAAIKFNQQMRAQRWLLTELKGHALFILV